MYNKEHVSACYEPTMHFQNNNKYFCNIIRKQMDM